jgi:hypothetical protein
MVIQIEYDAEGDENTACVEVMKDDGTKGFFSSSYLLSINQ